MYRLLIGVLVAGPVSAAPGLKKGTDGPLYFPVKEGAKIVMEVMDAGFESVDTPPGPKLRENFFARFTRRAEGADGREKRGEEGRGKE